MDLNLVTLEDGLLLRDKKWSEKMTVKGSFQWKYGVVFKAVVQRRVVKAEAVSL